MSAKKTQLEILIEQAVKQEIAAGLPTIKEELKTPKGPFKIGQFRMMKTLRERLQYLRTRSDVKEISAGSSRIAFFINNGKQVVKVAKWERGKAQNRTEVEAKNCGNKAYLPNVYANAADHSWVIVDSVIPLKSGKEFEEFTGYPLRAVEIGINYRSPEFQRRKDTDKTKKRYAQIYDIMSKRDSWYRGLVNMAVNCDLVAGDVGKWDSWGVTKRGRMVLIDYGLTEDVWNKYYARSS